MLRNNRQLERPSTYPSFLLDGEPPQPPFKFAIIVGGFKVLDSALAPVFTDHRIQTPTLHIQGMNDMIVSQERSQSLIDVCSNSRIEMHSGGEHADWTVDMHFFGELIPLAFGLGHFIPSMSSWRKFFKNYIRSFDPASEILPGQVFREGTETLLDSGASTPAKF